MRKRNRSLTVFLALAALVLAGCTLQFNNAIREDGSGEFRVELGFTPEQVVELSQAGTTPAEFCTQELSIDSDLQVPMQPDFQLEIRNEEIWCVAVIPFSELSQLTALLNSAEEINVTRIEIEGRRFLYDVTLDMTDRRRFSLGEGQEAGEVRWVVQVPGLLGGHNADSVTGNQLVWNLEPRTLRNLRAESTIGGPVNPSSDPIRLAAFLVTIACLCLVGVALVIGGAWTLWRRRTG